MPPKPGLRAAANSGRASQSATRLDTHHERTGRRRSRCRLPLELESQGDHEGNGE